MRYVTMVGLIAAITVGFVWSSEVSMSQPVSTDTAAQQVPKKLLFMTYAGLYKHTSLEPDCPKPPPHAAPGDGLRAWPPAGNRHGAASRP